MIPDKELILAVRNLKDGKRKDWMTNLLDQYYTACDLSRGPDPNRSEHWTINAVVLKRKLREALNTHTEVKTYGANAAT